jgi:hypothetical protein
MLNAIQLREAATPVNPRAHLSTILSARLNQWDQPLVRTASEAPLPRAIEIARELVRLFDGAERSLGDRSGARADAARKLISEAREPIADRIKLVDGLRADFSGPLGRELQARIVSTRAALASALAAKELATRATVDAALLEVERCLADCRELARNFEATNERLSVRLLQWPNLDELRSAQASTQALEKQSAKNPKAAAVHAAIAQGLEAPAHVAALFVAFESSPDHELVKWRWRAYAERGQ